VSLTYPHNPTGTVLGAEELAAVIDIVARSNAVLLFDETYRDLTPAPVLPMAASMSDCAVTVASMSKAYGLPGLRAGWLVCQRPRLLETFLAAKEQIFICGATLDEEIAGAVLGQRDRILPPILDRASVHRQIVADWIATEPLVEWVPPDGGVVCFPRVVAGVAFDADAFYRSLLADHGTYVGPGHWFEADDRHMRIGYGWPTTDELRAGLAGVSAALSATCGDTG
jgi:aspartate/methionine/tyrosine aminotransferase